MCKKKKRNKERDPHEVVPKHPGEKKVVLGLDFSTIFFVAMIVVVSNLIHSAKRKDSSDIKLTNPH